MSSIINIPLPSGSINNTPEVIVLHAMAQFINLDQAGSDYYASKGKNIPVGEYYAPEWLRLIGVSAHRLFTPTGLVIKCREDTQGAYHARGYNTNSLGYEFLVEGTHTYSSFLQEMTTDYITEDQFRIGIITVREAMTKWNLTSLNVTTHHELDPVRKHDPGTGFPLNRFITDLN